MLQEHRSQDIPAVPQACAIIDLDAIRNNVEALRARAGTAEVMAVVKADGYSHGLVPSARAALTGGASRLGVAVLEEAFALRTAGITAPVLAWLAVPGAPYRRAIDEDVDLSVHTIGQLNEIANAATVSGRAAHIHLKVDTGMARGGAATDDWPGLVEQARARELDGLVRIAGIWSHLACADQPGEPSIGRQLMVFDEALEVAARGGVRPDVRHIANSAATLHLPESHYDMVRPGIATYGVDPLPAEHRSHTVALRPAMTLGARLAQVKRVPAGTPVSYGHTYATAGDTTLGVVPLGYADGVPRSASGTGSVQVHGHRCAIAGRVCMDQFVVDIGDEPAEPGDIVVLFGPGDHGEPTAADWAQAAGTIAYETLTRIGGRIVRTYTGSTPMDTPPREPAPHATTPKEER
ncbi:alanine racemase [Rhodococcus oryzae]|uniref:Alanine racemase n=1 Tax=Rhodococcus oryzae TaxID=2571143 RepID=A0ABY2RGK1_9NOCA|nr:alanine racemase [Rhodococcus oryzae]TJZ76052.1 alanine racemase [Rhodococcus oryzae]